MIIGVPKEMKTKESRIAITPAGVRTFVGQGHTVYIETQAGVKSGFLNDDYVQAGAIIIEDAAELWARSNMIMKVKEPLPEEYAYFKKDLILFTYLHLAAEPALTKALQQAGVCAIAYETVLEQGRLPLLTPMSEVAGRMAVQIGTQFLQQTHGGSGVLLAGVPGVMRGKVTIIGGGIVGTNAAKLAVGLGADVTIIDANVNRLRELDDLFGTRIHTLVSNEANIAEAVKQSDLLIGAVLIPGAKAPKLVTEAMVQTMRKGSVIVDVAIDQGGIVETCDHITTHDAPVFEKYGVLHYAVANMPGAVPRTSTIALTNVTMPYAIQIANKGVYEALLQNEGLQQGLNVMNGEITYEAIADAFNERYTCSKQLLQEVNVQAV